MPHARQLLTRIALSAALVASATPAAAQIGRIGGVVKDTKGAPIKAATILVENAQASPSTFTATTDDKGRFAMIGLRTGTWKLTAAAPGFVSAGGPIQVRSLGPTPPLIQLTLLSDASGPPPALSGVNTRDLQAELAKGEMLMNQQEYDAAITVYRAILQRTPALTMINLQIGRAYRMKKEHEAALVAFKKILDTDAGNTYAHTEIGLTNLEKGDYAAAEAALAEAARDVSAGHEVFYNLGEVNFAKGATDEALKWYQRAIDMQPNWGKAYYKMGLAKLQKQEVAETIQLMEKVIAMEPSSAEAAQARGLIEQLQNRRP